MQNTENHLVPVDESTCPSVCELEEDELAANDSDGSTEIADAPRNGDRDEVLEIEQLTRKENKRVFFWKFTISIMLVLTAITLTSTTYTSLYEDEIKSFRTAVSFVVFVLWFSFSLPVRLRSLPKYDQFSRTVAQAAIAQQIEIRNAYSGFAKVVSASATATNSTWPFFTLHAFESIAATVRKQSGTEVFAVANVVPHETREEWETYATQHYEDHIREGHMTSHGSLDRLNPVGYADFISSLGAEGFEPDIQRDHYFPGRQWHGGTR